ncbi:hypothetical protein [Caballeronia hypogeia]|uniref:hypothetical protein n=1 Tax=Caballeronia hypogeia TaxID=1777140 RepID=UPI0012FDF029|nr:hypothetical protein [Caballeronia hypogeia]
MLSDAAISFCLWSIALMLKMHMKALTAKVKMTAANATPIFTAIGRFWIFFMVVFVWKAAVRLGDSRRASWIAFAPNLPERASYTLNDKEDGMP